jgi:hypothetical protein
MNNVIIHGVLYKATDPQGHCYIGQHQGDGSDIGKTYFGSGTYFTSTRKKRGKDYFTYTIIEYCYSSEHLNEMEIYYIKFFQARSYQNGYNLTDGGDGGFGAIDSLETRIKKSKAQLIIQNKPEVKQKIAETKNSKSDEEKAESIRKQLETKNSKSDEEKAATKKKTAETWASKSDEEKAVTSQKQSDAWYNKSEEEKVEINGRRSNNTKLYNTPEVRQKKSENISGEKHPMWNKQHSAKTIKQISESNKLTHNRPDMLKKKSEIAKIVMNRPEVKERCSKAHKGDNYPAHIRWHFNRGLINVDCQHCIDQIMKEHS